METVSTLFNQFLVLTMLEVTSPRLFNFFNRKEKQGEIVEQL